VDRLPQGDKSPAFFDERRIEMRALKTASAVTVLWAVAVGNAGAVPYVFRDLGTLAGTSSQAYGLNDLGQVVGSYYNSSGTQQAFEYSNGTMTDLGWGVGSCANGISSGQIVGLGNSPSDAFIMTAGTTRDVTAADGGGGAVYGTNDNKLSVGWYYGSGNAQNAYVFSPVGPMANLGGSCAYGINNSNQIAGTAGNYACLWSPGPNDTWTGTSLGGMANQYPSWGTNINSGGQVVGAGDTGFAVAGYGGYFCNPQAFLWTPTTPNGSTGTMHCLGTLGGASSQGNGINDSGQIVGWADTGSGAQDAFLYAGGSMQNLNSLLFPSCHWTLEDAQAINESGQIVGYGANTGGPIHAVLLTPAVPGDANGDGRVDINDLTIVLADFGCSGMNWFGGDFNGDGKVDINDLTIVLTNFGQTYAATGAGVGVAAAVPEPSGIALLLASAVSLLALAWQPWTA
jgi:probable HAF family extracellular repeat protein